MIRNCLVRSPGYYLFHPHHLVSDLYHEFEAFLYRGEHGWSPSDAKNMDIYLATIIPAMLRNLSENYVGAAEQWWDDTEGDETHLYREFLLRVAQHWDGYRWFSRLTPQSIYWHRERSPQNFATHLDGLQEMFKHYHDLGD